MMWLCYCNNIQVYHTLSKQLVQNFSEQLNFAGIFVYFVPKTQNLYLIKIVLSIRIVIDKKIHEILLIYSCAIICNYFQN